jgi:hypothetical protein
MRSRQLKPILTKALSGLFLLSDLFMMTMSKWRKAGIGRSNTGEDEMGDLMRGERLQIMLTEVELRALDDWRFARRMPSRAAAIRELLKRGLVAEGIELATEGMKSQAFGVLSEDENGSNAATA